MEERLRMNHWVFRNKYLFLLIVASIFLSYAALRSARFGGPGSLIGFGCIVDDVCFSGLNSSVIPEGAPVFSTGGYDGQFYYYVAAAIYSDYTLVSLSELKDLKTNSDVLVVDSMGFRLPRIGFPLVTGWLFGLGSRALMLGMPLLLLLVHLCASSMLFSARPRAGWLFALNPVSLLSFGLNLAEPLALSASLVAILLLLQKGSGRISGQSGMMRKSPLLVYGASAFLLILGFLSKETMFIVGLAFGAGLSVAAFTKIFRAIGSGKSGAAKIGSILERDFSVVLRWPVIVALLLSGTIAFAWYLWAGFFSGDGAGGKMNIPFSGVLDFIQTRPALISGRGLLLPGILWLTILALLLFIRCWKGKGSWMEQRFVLPGLWLNLALISMASAQEYWLTFANIVRLFAPAMVFLAFLRKNWMFRLSFLWVVLLTSLLWLNDLKALLQS